MIDMTLLAPTMQRKTEQLLTLFPEVTLTSGARTILQQARAMASNTLSHPSFCRETYPRTPELQAAIDGLREPLTLESCTDALSEVLLNLPLERRAKFAHMAGRAVDLSPSNLEDSQGIVTALGHLVQDWIRQQPETEYFTRREAGLVRWHWAVKLEA